MSDEAIRARLRAAGIPREAFATTLAKAGYSSLREYVANRVYSVTQIAYLFPKPSPRSTEYNENPELAFYLLAKELLLSGLEVHCCDLIDVRTALLSDSEDGGDLLSVLEAADVVAIRGFHDKGGRCEPFLTPFDSAYVASWLIRMHRNGTVLVLLGAAPLMEAKDWWPTSLLGYIRSRSILFEVK